MFEFFRIFTLQRRYNKNIIFTLWICPCVVWINNPENKVGSALLRDNFLASNTFFFDNGVAATWVEPAAPFPPQFGKNFPYTIKVICSESVFNAKPHKAKANPQKKPSLFFLPLPRWDHNGGSNIPWGSNPFSRQLKNARRCPPRGKWIGGRWTPSWPTSAIQSLSGPWWQWT